MCVGVRVSERALTTSLPVEPPVAASAGVRAARQRTLRALFIHIQPRFEQAVELILVACRQRQVGPHFGM